VIIWEVPARALLLLTVRVSKGIVSVAHVISELETASIAKTPPKNTRRAPNHAPAFARFFFSSSGVIGEIYHILTIMQQMWYNYVHETAYG
jgi:hypothetical protein